MVPRSLVRRDAINLGGKYWIGGWGEQVGDMVHL